MELKATSKMEKYGMQNQQLWHCNKVYFAHLAAAFGVIFHLF
jgi:hypothetical protein